MRIVQRKDLELTKKRQQINRDTCIIMNINLKSYPIFITRHLLKLAYKIIFKKSKFSLQFYLSERILLFLQPPNDLH